MGKRYLSLDFLRGLSIFGMIFSAIVPYGVLPAWMYHIQNPPPAHTLDMSVPGIGWVDLVFPVFIFCMGTAIPLSGRNGLQKRMGKSPTNASLAYVKGVVGRFIRLWAFSYLYVLLNYANVEGFWPQFFTLVGFGTLFLIYCKYQNRLLRYSGIALAVAIIAVGHFCFGEVVTLQRRGIIIFLLAFLYLDGSLIWYFTRNRLGIRALVFALLFIFTHITRMLDWPAITYANPNIRWWFNMEYFYFLLLLIPATVVGDILAKAGDVGYKSLSVSAGADSAGSSVSQQESGRKSIAVSEHLLYPSMLLFVVWQCYALYMGITLANVVVTLLYMGSIILLSGRKDKNRRTLLLMAGVLIVWGVVFSAIEGGIKKVPCTISYCLATCGISILLLFVADYICKWLPGSLFVKVFSGAGQNPLMSYIAFDSLVVPLMKITGIIHLYNSLYTAPDGNVALGLLRAAAAVFFTMWLVSCFSRKGVFWKA